MTKKQKKNKKKEKQLLPDPLNSVEIIKKIRELITGSKYIFDPHAEKRFIERGIQPLQVLDILRGALRHDSAMNEYSNHFECWTYAIFGKNKEFELKVVTGFKDKNLLIITVVKVQKRS